MKQFLISTKKLRQTLRDRLPILDIMLTRVLDAEDKFLEWYYKI